jgi:hypothetical protein
MVESGFLVVPVNPDLIARRRGPAKKKDDAEDARIACCWRSIATSGCARLSPMTRSRPSCGPSPATMSGPARDERRLLNRLRDDLIATFPAALAIVGEDMGAATFLRMLERWPHRGSAGQRLPGGLVAFARTNHNKYAERFADRAQAALAKTHFSAPSYLVRAKADAIRLAAAQLLLIGAQRRAWERRMGELLLGGRRRGKAKKPREDERGQAFPGGEIYLNFPGLGDRLAARIAGEIGDHFEQFETPSSLQCYAGKAPVTRCSGKTKLVVAHRLACNRHLANAVQEWAFASLLRSEWPGSSTTNSAPRERANKRPSSSRQPVAGGPLALPAQGRALRRSRPCRHPEPRPRKGRSGRLADGG